jgi:flagellar P-ring protein precursor FlgI
MAHAYLRQDPPILSRRLARPGPLALALALAAALALTGPAGAARVKDLADLQGFRSNPLLGYGLVVGLKGTGDSSGSLFANRSLAGLLSKLGIVVQGPLKVTNVAAVMVTSELPPFARVGQTLDVTVSSLGDAQSLQGAMLLATPLLGVDAQVYAVAQGPVTIGGYSAQSAQGDSVQQNHPTVGRTPGGAIVEREIPLELHERASLRLILRQQDLTTAARMALAVNQAIGPGIAHAADAGSVDIEIPQEHRDDPVPFLARIQELSVEPGRAAIVVLNERTGTVVMGSEVELAPVAIAHGALSIRVAARTQVSQPAPFSEKGSTVAFDNDVLVVQEQGSKLAVVQGVTIGELVHSLNSIGASPRDLIAILQAVRAAGALRAELKVI